MSDEITQPTAEQAPIDEKPVEPTTELSVEATPKHDEQPPICFIGNEPIYSAEKNGDFTTVELKGGAKKRIHNLLFDKVIAPEANENGGTVDDMVNTTVAKEIIALFTIYDLTLGEADLVLNYASTNATNLKRSGDKKLWSGKRMEDVSFQDIRTVLS